MEFSLIDSPFPLGGGQKSRNKSQEIKSPGDESPSAFKSGNSCVQLQKGFLPIVKLEQRPGSQVNDIIVYHITKYL